MDPGTISAFAASPVGDRRADIADRVWLSQHVQVKTQRLERNVVRRQDLYRDSSRSVEVVRTRL